MRWWRDAVVYQIDVRGFADSDGDGVGDLAGLRSRLGYLELLGVDAIWLAPFSPSPMADHGYDVADPRDVDPALGDFDGFDALVADAHRHGLRVVVGLVPNHTSTEHAWFRAARAAPARSPERYRYHFRPGRGVGGAAPPNDWTSVYGGSAWTRVAASDGTGGSDNAGAADDAGGEWYLHLFSPGQADLNWANPEVWDDFESTLRFWLDRGVDGFHLDTGHGLCKPADLDAERFDHDEVHVVHRMIRAVVDHYPEAVLLGEVGVCDDERFARYVRPDELHLGFHFGFLQAGFDAAAIQAAVQRTSAAVAAVGAVPTWTVSNHEVSRPVTRYGGGPRGVARARAMALVELALPGTVSLYHGEELGLPDADLPDVLRRDPVFARSGGAERGRDDVRVPVPWEGGPPGFGFTAGEPRQPMPAHWAGITVAEQLEDVTSTLSLFRQAIDLRRAHPAFRRGHDGDRDGDGAERIEWFGAPPGCLAFRRADAALVCALNTSDVAVSLPPGDVLLASAPLAGGELPPDTAAWLV